MHLWPSKARNDTFLIPRFVLYLATSFIFFIWDGGLLCSPGWDQSQECWDCWDCWNCRCRPNTTAHYKWHSCVYMTRLKLFCWGSHSGTKANMWHYCHSYLSVGSLRGIDWDLTFSAFSQQKMVLLMMKFFISKLSFILYVLLRVEKLVLNLF